MTYQGQRQVSAFLNNLVLLVDALNKMNRRKPKKSPGKNQKSTAKTTDKIEKPPSSSDSSNSSENEEDKEKEKPDNESTSLSNHGGSSIDNASFSDMSDNIDPEKQGPAFGKRPDNLKSQQM